MKKFLIALTCTLYASLQAAELEVKVLDINSQPVTNIVVYLENEDGVLLEKTAKAIEINQSNKSFLPYISVMQKGNLVHFNNKDDITHHIYSPLGENKFSFKILAGEKKTIEHFSTAGEIAMGCNIHDWMSGHLLIVATPYFDKTNGNGIANISVKEEGNYNLTLWHPQLGERDNQLTKKITIKGDMNKVLQLTQEMAVLPEQKNEDDFDFLSDY